jgi:hypothetical protein
VKRASGVNEGFVPVISKLPGFVAYYWVDAGGGVMISTSIFQDQASEEESNRKAADWVPTEQYERIDAQPAADHGG